MSINEMEIKVREYKELADFIDELQAEANEKKAEIVREMEARDTEEMKCGEYVVRWVEVLSTRFNTSEMKQRFGEAIYNSLTKQVRSHRFTVA